MLNPEELVASITGVAVVLSKNLSEEDIGLLSVVFSQLGDTLATLSVAQARCRGE